MLQFDVTSYYSLFEVFERTGRLMFRDQWTGQEIWSKPIENPAPVINQRRTLSSKLAKAIRHKADLDDSLQNDLDPDTEDELRKNWSTTYAKIEALKQDIAKLPQTSDAYIADHELFARRQAVEQELWEAFMDNSLRAQLRGNSLLDWRACSRHPSFKVHYCLSMIIPPPEQGHSFRRSPAFVQKKSFAQWSERFGTAIYCDERYAPKQRARAWLQEQVNKYGRKPYGKTRFVHEMISGFDISKREAARIWQDVTPDAWKKSGPVAPK